MHWQNDCIITRTDTLSCLPESEIIWPPMAQVNLLTMLSAQTRFDYYQYVEHDDSLSSKLSSLFLLICNSLNLLKINMAMA